MQNLRKAFAVLLALALIICVTCAAAAEAEEDGSGTVAPADDDTQTEPAAAEPEPATAAPATQAPASTPPPATPAPETPVPTQAPQTQPASPVNVIMYVYTASDHPASGYTVSIDSTSQTTNAQGMAGFTAVSIGQHSVTITSPDGASSIGRLYMSRGSSTVLTDQAMGGTYGMNIAEGQNDVYMLITFEPDNPLLIRALSNEQPALPEPPEEAVSIAPADIQYPAKQVIATFLDQQDEPMAGLEVTVGTPEGQTYNQVTDSRGRAGFDNISYGTYGIAVQGTSVPVTQFTLTLEPAARTAIAQNAGNNCVVQSSVTAKQLYLQFRQVGGMLVLTDASDSPVGGLNPMMLGMIIVGAIVAAIIVVVVVSRKKKKDAAVRRRPTIRTNVPAGGTSPEDDRNVSAERPLHPHESEDVLKDPAAPKTTGGANKFDDRSKL